MSDILEHSIGHLMCRVRPLDSNGLVELSRMVYVHDWQTCKSVYGRVGSLVRRFSREDEHYGVSYAKALQIQLLMGMASSSGRSIKAADDAKSRNP